MRQVLIHIEPHMRELKADVGIEFVSGNLVEQIVIELGAGPRLVSVGDVLTKVVDGNARAELVDGSCGANRGLSWRGNDDSDAIGARRRR